MTVSSLRHFDASVTLQSGQNPVIVSKRLGHPSVWTTSDIFARAKEWWNADGLGGHRHIRIRDIGRLSHVDCRATLSRVLGWILIQLVFLAGAVTLVIGNPLWPDVALKFLMSPVILLMGWGIGNRLGAPNWPADWPQHPLLVNGTTQGMLRSLMTLSILLSILVVLLVVCT